MICWICNQREGTTREHRSKRSDLKAVFGSSVGLYFHDDHRRNRWVQSVNSKLIKINAPLCNTCNSARTQPHDLAWETLSHNLRTRRPAIKPDDAIRCNRIFPYDTSRSMLGVQLFFVKWLGCQIVEAGIPTRPPLATFADAIMRGKAHQNIWLSFRCRGRNEPPILASDVHAASLTPEQGYDDLAQFYCVDNLAVRVRFSEVRLPDDWHPRDGNRLVAHDSP